MMRRSIDVLTLFVLILMSAVLILVLIPLIKNGFGIGSIQPSPTNALASTSPPVKPATETSTPTTQVQPPIVSVTPTISSILTPGPDKLSSGNTLTSSRQITVAYSFEDGPFSYNVDPQGQAILDENGTPAGLEVEMVKEFVKRTLRVSSDEEVDKIIKWVPIHEYERIDKATESGIDFVVGAISYTPDRCLGSERVCTQEFHWRDHAALLVHQDANIVDFCSTTLTDKNIATIAKTTSESAGSNAITHCEKPVNYGSFIGYETLEQAINSLQEKNENKVIAYISDYRLLVFDMQLPQYKNKFKIIGHEQPLQPEEYVFIMKKKNEGLRALLDRYIKQIRIDEKWNQWLKKYSLNK